MRKIGDLMNELGFRKDAPEEVKKAFIKNLIKQAYGAEVVELAETKREPAQLSFEFEELTKGQKVS